MVKRALSLIETGNDLNNLTIVSSTVYRAIDNVIERLDQDFQTDFLYLKGGSKKVISEPDGAAEKIQDAISYLQASSFDEQRHRSLAQAIQQLKRSLVNAEKDFLNLRQVRHREIAQQLRLREQVQNLEQQLSEIESSIKKYRRVSQNLSAYQQFPKTVYEELRQLFSDAQQSLPSRSSFWLIQVWNWLRRKTEKHILMRLEQESRSLIAQIQQSQFLTNLLALDNH